MIKVLLPALITNEEQEKMTRNCLRSLEDSSIKNELDIIVDKEKYKYQVAGVWNKFLDDWRGKDYDYLLITANDMLAHPKAIEYMIKCSKDNGNNKIVTSRVTRDLSEFLNICKEVDYENVLTTTLKDPATILFPKGIIEKVGKIDNQFPCEFVERDYIYRAKLADIEWIQPDQILWFHPDHSGTIGNPIERLQLALKKYVAKWGGDANQETYKYPYNNMSLDFTYCLK